MRNIILVTVGLIVLQSCKPTRRCDIDYRKIIKVIVDDMTLHHPVSVFIQPPTLDHNSDPKPRDRSQGIYGLSNQFSDTSFRQNIQKKMGQLLREHRDIYLCHTVLGQEDLVDVSIALSMNLVYTDHDPRLNIFGYDLDGPRALFYFSSVRVYKEEKQTLYAIGVLFLCGKLCADERLFILKRNDEEYKILHMQDLSPNELH